ncbi:apolipoprotein F [Ambystoma mexicanum]|uniref:apolipoprotein F n=1 Tax=Ambystoma mexicanum TaxID=8296 RepID=UPI0037E82D7D
MVWKHLTCLCLSLLVEQLCGHRLPPGSVGRNDGPPVFNGADNPAMESTGGAALHQPTEDERKTSARGLLEAIARGFSTPGLSRAWADQSCQDLSLIESMPGHLQLSRDFVDIALVLALGGHGCCAEAEPRILELYEDLGVTETNEIFLEILAHIGTHSWPSVVAGTHNSVSNQMDRADNSALQFNVDQIAATVWGPVDEPLSPCCAELAQVNNSLLVGVISSNHTYFAGAASECQLLGASCAGVATNATGQFQVLKRVGSYFLPCPGACSWLHHCRGACHALQRRSLPYHCQDQQEQKVHGVMQWVPLASSFYNLGTTVYYAVQNCSELAKERALEAAFDLGYDAVVAMTGGSSGIVGYGVAACLKPGVRAGVRAVIDYFRNNNASKQ